MNESGGGCFLMILGLVGIIGAVYFLVHGFSGTKQDKSIDTLIEEKVSTGSYSGRSVGTHEYRRDANGHEYVRSSSVTIIE